MYMVLWFALTDCYCLSSLGTPTNHQEATGSDIVFIAGGACFSEVRSVYEVRKEQNAEIILGATSLITPSQFLDGLSGLDGQHSVGTIALEGLQIDIEE
jgi:hypothetical protein